MVLALDLPPTTTQSPQTQPLTPPTTIPSTTDSSSTLPPYDPFIPISSLYPSQPSQTHLITSPYYTSPSHLLDLTDPDLSESCRLLARALTFMKPITQAYATVEYKSAFNWDEIISHLRSSPSLSQLISSSSPTTNFPETSFFIIVFRSQIPTTTVRPRLGILDQEAHKEAVSSGGLLKYWFGIPDSDGRNLATCVWRERGDARKGGRGPGHKRAMTEAVGLYTEWKVERLRLVVGERAREWDIIEWED